MTGPSRFITLFLILISCSITLNAQRHRTTIQGPLRSITSPEHTTSGSTPSCGISDTIIITPATHNTDSITRLSGYDKPISASRETLHISNLTDTLTITGIDFTIRYLDRKGRELHRRTVNLHHTVYPRHTELATFPTWDIQRSFYYILSIKPRRQATPYDIDIHIDSITAIPSCKQ